MLAVCAASKVVVMGLLLKFFLTTFGIKDILGLSSLALRLGAKPNVLTGFAEALVDGLGGGAEIATDILKVKENYLIKTNFYVFLVYDIELTL